MARRGFRVPSCRLANDMLMIGKRAANLSLACLRQLHTLQRSRAVANRKARSRRARFSAVAEKPTTRRNLGETEATLHSLHPLGEAAQRRSRIAADLCVALEGLGE